ncbi:MAG: methyltransferase domain-containing protein [Acidimicrobiia bacterium]
MVLAPRRAIHRRRWVRRHEEISRTDRAVLVNTIIPAVREEADGADVLFVGVQWYTADYASMFPGDSLVTIDLDPALAPHGGRRHVVGDVLELSRHFERGQFAAVICNGVLGFGVDARADVHRALEEIATCVRSGGVLVVGWNDTDELHPDDLDGAATRAGMVSTPGAGLASWRNGPYGALRHTYDVYRRPSVPEL